MRIRKYMLLYACQGLVREIQESFDCMYESESGKFVVRPSINKSGKVKINIGYENK